MAGPLIATLLLISLTQNLRVIFILAFIPAMLCLWILYRGVTDTPKNRISTPPSLRLRWGEWDRKFKSFLFIITLFTLGNSSDAFLLLRAKDLGIDIVSIPVLWFILHLSKTIFSIPGGSLSDRMGRRRMMVIAWMVYGFVYIGFAFASKAYHIWLLFFIYGLFFGLSEGTERAWVADLVEESKRGTAYGTYHFFIGMATLPASLLMGLIWKTAGVTWAFSWGAMMALIAALFAMILMRDRQTENLKTQNPNAK
jgi:MFS family permease